MSVRYLAAAVRALSPAAAFALTLAAVLGATGVADGAISSGAFILGRSNAESATASLSSSKGTPLSLSAPRNTAPLAVNRNAMVKNLNASFVGGLSSAGLKLSGGERFLPVEANKMITGDVFTKVAGTPRLAAGTYYVIATALINVTTGDTGATCVIEKDDDDVTMFAQGGADGAHFIQASETVALSLPKGGTVQESCMIKGTKVGSVVDDAGLTAIRISASSGKKAASH
jgi:hypothetical protein